MREKSKHKNGAQLHGWVVSGLPGTYAKWNQVTTSERPALFSKFSHI